MVSMFEWRARIAQYFAFTGKEVRDLLIAIVFTGFIFSFRDWGTASGIDVLLGTRNLIIVTLIAAFSFFVHESVHRIFALLIGYKAEFKLWWGGLLASLVLVFASNGIVQLILPGGMVSALIMRHRLGEFRHGFNFWENGVVALVGPLSNLMMAFIAKFFLFYFPGSWFLQKFMFLNIVFAICTMLPIPPLDGVNLFFAGRLVYVEAFVGILAAGILIYFTGPLLALVGGIIILVIATLLYYLAFENKPL